MGARSSKGPASAPAPPSEAWWAWQEAVVALRKHERTCTDCVVDRYCGKGVELNTAEVGAHWVVTHPGETP